MPSTQAAFTGVMGCRTMRCRARFLASFSPLTGTRSWHDEHVHLAFPVDGSDDAVAVCLQSDGDTVGCKFVGYADLDMVRKQVARIFALDVDGGPFAAVGQRDPVIGELQARYPGLQPVSLLEGRKSARFLLSVLFAPGWRTRQISSA